jgi:hypothetical protein
LPPKQIAAKVTAKRSGANAGVMKTYLVACNLHSPGEAYETLIDLLQRSWNGRRIGNNIWIVEVEDRAVRALEQLTPLVGPDDSVVMIEVVPGADWGKLEGPTGWLNWLQERISPRAVTA